MDKWGIFEWIDSGLGKDRFGWIGRGVGKGIIGGIGRGVGKCKGGAALFLYKISNLGCPVRKHK